ncbi:MAG TPA: sigma-70 family RNA polymerase sigma factor [Opitutaceae bacterium]|nr:sigma-70 family RNA polymerase sigma factor [Opitutaceae bacterium]
MTPTTLSTADRNDTELVEQSLAGDRQAFGQIVARYQSLVCGLAYSATGSRSRSEDLAQETFLAAWQKLRDLHEPGRLCAWLCGIARNIIQGDRRRLGRQPAHAADTLDTALELPSAEPLPDAQAVSNEEMAILWREIGRLPEVYREPLILFYRDHRSVEHVAAALGLTPDAVMQRLTRGRRELQERMLVFVESTLLRTNPGPQFTLQVQAALPLLVGAGPAVAVGTAAKGGAAAKGGLLGFLLAWAAPLVGVFAAIGISWAEITQAATKRERRFAARWMLVLWLSVLGFVAAQYGVASLAWSAGLDQRQDWTATAPRVAVWFGFTMSSLTLIVFMLRGKNALRRQMMAEGLVSSSVAVAPSMKKRVALTVGFLTATFWVLIFLAWQTGDRLVAGAIVGGVFLLGAAPFCLARIRPRPVDETKAGGWYISICGLVFLGILNWRLDVWLAPIYGVGSDTMQRLLPMAIIHWLSAIAVAWTAALVFITQPDEKP